MKIANRVAFNTVVQYVQLVLNVLIGLYSVRIILNALGASDYGIYDLIAGVVSLLSFISTSLSQTSMRFLSISLGAGNNKKTGRIFSVCIWLHLYIAILLSFLLFLLGFFLFDGFLNIPEERITVARALYYLMVFGLFLNIIVTPFSAMIAAHEKFVYLSCVQILDSLCKLGIALIISVSSWDKLLLYGLLMLGITVVNVLCYVLYAAIKYKDKMSLYRPRISEMKEVLGFASWTLLDVLGSVVTRQGYAVLLNTFFGTVTNAVFALSRQIEGHMYTISASVINTMKPQIMKSQGAGETARMFRLSLTAGKFGFSMMALIAIPLIVMMPEVLTLWLKEVPEGTVLFSRLMIMACMFEQLTKGLVYANQAIGNIKWFSISISAIRILALPISWVFFHYGSPAYVAIVVFLVCETIGSFSRVFIMSKISNFRIIDFVKSVFIQILPPFAISFVICMFSSHFFNGILGMVAVCVITIMTYVFLLISLGLTKEERITIVGLLNSLSRGILSSFLNEKI